MSRFSLPFFQSVLTDPDATSSNSANSSNSLSVSPAIERDFDLVKPTHHQPFSNHLLELQKEIKEEGDEIFADINSVINNRSDLYSSSFDYTDDYEDDNRNIVSLTRQITTTTTTTNNNNNNIISNRRAYDTSLNFLDRLPDDDRGYRLRRQEEEEQPTEELVQSDELFRQHQLLSHHLEEQQSHQQEQHEKVENHFTNDDEEQNYVSCNQAGQQQLLLEQQQQQQLEQEQEQQNYHAIQQQEDIQQVTSNLPKPCVFFLEGNCRRSDCKYSHDLSSITCKYWIEGFCFKGEMCPFLHSFNPSGPQDSSLLDDDGFGLSKKNLTPTFVIESEADFPSLPLDAPCVTLNETTQAIVDSSALTKTIKNQILSSNPAVVFKSTKKKRKKG